MYNLLSNGGPMHHCSNYFTTIFFFFIFNFRTSRTTKKVSSLFIKNRRYTDSVLQNTVYLFIHQYPINNRHHTSCQNYRFGNSPRKFTKAFCRRRGFNFKLFFLPRLVYTQLITFFYDH